MKKTFAVLGLAAFAMIASAADLSGGNMTASDRALVQKLGELKALPAENRGSVLIIGDSMMRLLGTELEKEFAAAHPDVVVTAFSSLGSGLVRQDSFD